CLGVDAVLHGRADIALCRLPGQALGDELCHEVRAAGPPPRLGAGDGIGDTRGAEAAAPGSEPFLAPLDDLLGHDFLRFFASRAAIAFLNWLAGISET